MSNRRLAPAEVQPQEFAFTADTSASMWPRHMKSMA